jgi:hypothetical protein
MLNRIRFIVMQCRLWWSQMNEQDARCDALLAEHTKREAHRDIARLTAQQIELKQRMRQMGVTQ